MNALPLVSPDAGLLRAPALPVISFGPDLDELIGQMLTRIVLDGWDALSAPHLGAPVRVVVYRIDGHQGYLVNPRLQRADGVQQVPDVCPSAPDAAFLVRRPMSVVVSGVDAENRPTFVRAVGRGAAALHHELDHLDGNAHPDGGMVVSSPAD